MSEIEATSLVAPEQIAVLDLVSNLDVIENVAQLARLVVPLLGSWSIVSLIDASGSVNDAGSWHVDGTRQSDVSAYSDLRLSNAVGESLVAQAVRTRLPITVDAVEAAALVQPGPALVLFEALTPAFIAVLPILARGRAVGVLTVYADSAWTDVQRAVADQIVARAALVIDNSLSYERERTARTAAEDAEQRLLLLRRVSDTLASTDDPNQAVGRLAAVVVPALGDWSFVTVINDDGSLSDIGIAHHDPAMADVMAAYSATHLEAMSEDAAVSRALRTGAPVIVPKMREAILTSFLPDPAVAELTRRLDPHGVASFPLTARGRTLGALTVATTSPRGPHTDDEIALGLEISRRAGPILDAARAMQRARSLVETMQRNVLSIAVPREGLHVAARYRPAYLDHEIGGDWYDSFPLPSGSTVLVIGDVMGHDVAAIAAMAQMRTLVRAAAWTLGNSPAQILSATDGANVGLGTKTFATATVVELSAPNPDGSVGIRWSSAGHLPAIVIDPDGSVRTLEPERPDIPLGVIADIPRHDHADTLRAGSTLVLYTDGLVERRGESLDVGIAGLTQTLADIGQRDVETMLDALLDDAIDDRPHDDDVALLAVRIGDRGDSEMPSRAVQLAIDLPADPRAPAVAREVFAQHAVNVPREIADDALVAISELVTNAVRYGTPGFRMQLTVTEDLLRVVVSDQGPELMVRHTGAPDPTSSGGRGLLIVQSLASAWGVIHDDSSAAKSVWFEIRLGR